MDMSLERAFIDLGIVSATFHLSDQRDTAGDRGGVLRPTAYGARRWMGDGVIVPRRSGLIEKIEARLHRLTEADGVFLVCPYERQADAETTGALTSISATDRRVLTATNAAALDEGDWIGVVHDGGRRSLHQVHGRDGASIHVVPPLLPSVVVGDVTTYGRPTIRAVIAKGSYRPAKHEATYADGASFAWFQTLERPA